MLNQRDLLNRVNERLGNQYKPRDLDIICREIFGCILDATQNGEDVAITNFGKFFARFIKGKTIMKAGIPWLRGKQYTIPNRFRLGFSGSFHANRRVATLIDKLQKTPPQQVRNVG